MYTNIKKPRRAKMNVKMHNTGMIFRCKTQCATPSVNDNTLHNYIILGYSNNPKLGRIQMMSITSMMNKELEMYEVPLIINGMVSYIATHNIYSELSSEVRLENFRGCISDTEYITVDEFILLLMDVYTLNLTGIDRRDTVKRYNEYCKKFWEENNGIKEYRHVKVENKYNTFNNNVCVKHDEIINTPENETNVCLVENSEETTPSSQSTGFNIEPSYTVDVHDIKKLDTAPRQAIFWAKEQCELLIRLYAKYEIKTLIEASDRWSSESALSTVHSKCVEICKKRGWDVTIEPTQKLIKKWNDDEINKFLYLIKNINGEFISNNKLLINQVKREADRRNIYY